MTSVYISDMRMCIDLITCTNVFCSIEIDHEFINTQKMAWFCKDLFLCFWLQKVVTSLKHCQSPRCKQYRVDFVVAVVAFPFHVHFTVLPLDPVNSRNATSQWKTSLYITASLIGRSHGWAGTVLCTFHQIPCKNAPANESSHSMYIQ